MSQDKIEELERLEQNITLLIDGDIDINTFQVRYYGYAIKEIIEELKEEE